VTIRAISALLAWALAACSPVQPAPEPSGESSLASGAAAPSPSASRLISPGRPFDAADILAAMRGSRRPGGVPDVLETDAVAGAVAAEIWTIDGEPWADVAAGGSCGPVRCTLDLSGRHRGAAGEDVWMLEVIPASGDVAVLDTNLGSLPPGVVADLDRVARAQDRRPDAADLILTGVRWSGPQQEARFQLSYRSGDEEGTCELELEVDTEGETAETLSAIGC
jgi:hypothetical protein